MLTIEQRKLLRQNANDNIVSRKISRGTQIYNDKLSEIGDVSSKIEKGELLSPKELSDYKNKLAEIKSFANYIYDSVSTYQNESKSSQASQFLNSIKTNIDTLTSVKDNVDNINVDNYSSAFYSNKLSQEKLNLETYGDYQKELEAAKKELSNASSDDENYAYLKFKYDYLKNYIKTEGFKTRKTYIANEDTDYNTFDVYEGRIRHLKKQMTSETDKDKKQALLDEYNLLIDLHTQWTESEGWRPEDYDQAINSTDFDEVVKKGYLIENKSVASNNNNMSAVQMFAQKKNSGSMVSDLFGNMSVEDKYYYYLLGQGREGEAKTYKSRLSSKKEEASKQNEIRRMQDEIKYLYDNSEWYGKVGLNIVSVPAKVFGGAVGAAADVNSLIRYGKVEDYYNPITDFGNTIQNLTEEELTSTTDNEVAKTAIKYGYNLATTTAEMWLGSKFGSTGHGVLMGTGSAHDYAHDAIKRGASTEQVIVGSVLTGVAEGIFEKYSLDKIVSLSSSSGPLKTLGNMALSGVIEASEEDFTLTTQNWIDAMVMGAKSNKNLRIKELMSEGKTREEAEKISAYEDFQERMWTVALAFGSGSAFYGGNKVKSNLAKYSEGKQILNEEGYDDLRSLAVSTKNEALGKDVKDIGKALDKTERKLTPFRVGKLSEAVSTARDNQNLGDIQTALEEKGFSKKKSQKVAEEFLEVLNSEEITQKQYNEITKDEATFEVFRSLISDTDSSVNTRNLKHFLARNGIEVVDETDNEFDAQIGLQTERLLGGNEGASVGVDNDFDSQINAQVDMVETTRAIESEMRERGTNNTERAVNVLVQTGQERAIADKVVEATTYTDKDGKVQVRVNDARGVLPKNYTAEERAIESFFKKRGINMAVFESESDVDGFKNGNTVYLNRKTAKKYVFKHEFSHFFEKADGYEAFGKNIEKAVESSKTLRAWVEKKASRLKGYDKNSTLSAKIGLIKNNYKAQRDGNPSNTEDNFEFYADFVMDNLYNGTDIESTIAELENAFEDKGTWQKFCDFMRRLIKHIKNLGIYDGVKIAKLESQFAKVVRSEKTVANDNKVVFNSKTSMSVSVDRDDGKWYNVSRANKEGELVNQFYNALSKSEWKSYYSQIASLGYLEKVNIGDKITVVVGNKIILSERIPTGKDAHDFQVYNIYCVSKENQFVLDEIRDTIIKEGVYDGQGIRKSINRIIRDYGVTEVFEQHSWNDRSTVDNDAKNKSSKGDRNVFRNNQNKTNRTRISDKNQRNRQGIKAEVDTPAFSISENFNDKEHNEVYADAVKKHFGVTYNWNETGYILADGSKLDFSGKNMGARGGSRTIDHREINQFAFEEDNEFNLFLQDLEGSDKIVDFLNRGNIRIMPETAGIELSVKPTEQQITQLKNFISRNNGEVTLDIADETGNIVASLQYPKHIKSDVVINDIIDYFDKGRVPQEFGGVRFSISDEIDDSGNRVSFKDDLLSNQKGQKILRDFGSRIEKAISSFKIFDNWLDEKAKTLNGYHKELTNENKIKLVQKSYNTNQSKQNEPTLKQKFEFYADFIYDNLLYGENSDSALKTLESSFRYKEDFDKFKKVLFDIAKNYVNLNKNAYIDNNADIDNYTEKQYNDFGWVAVNGVLNVDEWAEYNGKLEESLKNKDLKNIKGETVITVGNHSSDITAVMYIKGTFKNPIITKVVRVISDVSKVEASNFYMELVYYEREKVDNAVKYVENISGKGFFIEFTNEDFESLQELRRASKRSVSGKNHKNNKHISNRTGSDGTNTQTEAGLEKSAFSISDDFDELVDTYGAIDEGMNAQRDIKVPKRTSKNQYTSLAARSIMEKGSVDDATLEQIKEQVVSEALSHKRWSDKEAREYALKQLKDDEAEIIWNDVVSGKTVLDKNKIAVAEGLLEIYANAGKANKVLTLTAELCEVGTRAGQVVQAFSLLKKMGGVGRLYYLQKVADSINRDIEKRFGKKAKRIKIEESLATRMINAKTDEEVQDASEDIIKALGEQMPQTFLDKWNAWRYLSMLGNPRTHIRNFFGNAIFIPAIKIKNGIATALEHAFIKDEGNRTKAIKVSEDVKEFAEKDFEEMKGFITSGGKYQDGSQVQDYVRVFKNQILEGARKFNFDMLEREDAFFLKLHYKKAFGQFITARGLDINNLTEKQLWEAREYAVLEAQKATYRDASAVASAINRLSQQNKVANVVVEGILPFKKTPINILKRGVEYSPIGLLTTLSKGSFDLRNGKITASQYIDGISSGLTGTGIMALGVLLGSLGVAIGGFGDDEDKWFRQQNGEQEYSLVFFGHSYTVDWAAPSCIPFFIGVELQKVLSGENDNVATAFVNALDGALEPLTNLSMLQGINDTLDTIKWSDSPLTSIVSDSITSYFTQALPTLAGQVTRVANGTRYKNYVDKNSAVPEWLQQVANTVSSKTGNWGKNPYRNAWGETEVDDSLIGRIVSNFLSPGYYSKVNYDGVNEEIARLYNAKGNKLVLPDTVDNKISVNGEYKYLTADEYEEYQIAVGQSAYEYIDQVINSDFYKNADDNTRVDMIADIYSYCENVGKTTVSDYELSSSDLKVKLYLERGVTMAEYLESEYSNQVETEEISTDVDAVNELLDDIEENYSGATEKMSMVDMAVNFIRDKQRKSLAKKDAFIDTASSSGYDIGGMFVANADYESTDKKADKIDAIRKSDADESEKFLSMAYVYLDRRKVTYKGKYDSFSKLSPSDKLRYISAHESEIRAGINSDY